MRVKTAAFAIVLFAALFVFLETAHRFHFFYIEQNRLFLMSGAYFWETVGAPAGPSSWVAGFLVQLFTLPYVGALVTAGLLTGAGVLTALICRRIAPAALLYLLWALPTVGLLCIHFDFNYMYRGTVAFLGVLAALWLYVSLPRLRNRVVAGTILVPLLFWWGGSVATLFALLVVMWEAMTRTPRWYLSLVVAAEMALIAGASIWFLIFEDWDVFSPGLYLPFGIVPNEELWFPWIALPVSMAGALLMRRFWQRPMSLKRESVVTIGQVAIVTLLAAAGTRTYFDQRAYRLKELNHYVRTEDWNAVIANSRGSLDNYLHLSYLNLALAQKGTLADDLFSYDQRGAEGLFVEWNGTAAAAIALSDVNFMVGNISVAQQMAFVGNVIIMPGYGSARIVQRLVQTNLIFGFYPAAEKYIRLLEQTMFYREWAARHREFLYNDDAVAADPTLGAKRRSLPAGNEVSSNIGYHDLEVVARTNPADKTAVEYLGALMLTSKDMASFQTLLEIYFGTEVLPALPRSFQEAVMSMYEHNPEVWRQYGVSRETIDRFAEFRRQVLAGRGNGGLENSLRRSFGDTFWFYYMFK
ncbi:MAG: DUF6057 family protein [Alistipes sp.]|jgi:hypothetical protein|nr:DUF6057 family protein [Alistipes sp.]